MSDTATAGALLQEKYGARFQQKQNLNTDDASIENKACKTLTNDTSIELPAEIKELITGSDFWVLAKTNRYKKLIREGHLDKLLALAKLAHEKATNEHPSHWFARACSKARWEKYTLPYFAKVAEVVQKADQVARRIGTKVNKFIYKQIWKGVNVERWAIQAEEMQHNKPGQNKAKHFAWLCLNEKTVLAGMERP